MAGADDEITPESILADYCGLHPQQHTANRVLAALGARWPMATISVREDKYGDIEATIQMWPNRKLNGIVVGSAARNIVAACTRKSPLYTYTWGNHGKSLTVRVTTEPPF